MAKIYLLMTDNEEIYDVYYDEHDAILNAIDLGRPVEIRVVTEHKLWRKIGEG